MTISAESWAKYVKRLSAVSKTAAAKMQKFILKLPQPWDSQENRQKIIDYAFALASKYGEAAAELACEMYDEVGLLEDLILPGAVPAETATYSETAKTVNGTLKTLNEVILADAVARLVKQTAEDTIYHNAYRDHAQIAWIAFGDTCPYCLMLSAEGWQDVFEDVAHADHIHANCDCTHAVRHKEDTDVGGYKPGLFKRMYANADGATQEEKLNSMRRAAYARNSEEINAQKRSAYEKQKEREASAAEEINVN